MDKHPIVSSDSTLKECMVVIDKFAKRISFVLEEEILVGVVTDGDIRRALLNGSVIEDAVSSIMNRKFVSFPVDTNSKTIRERFTKRVRHIPLVDDDGKLVDVADPQGNFRISVLEPSMQGNEMNYVTECIKTNWISSQGKYVTKFEDIFHEFHHGYHPLAVSNGTVALHLALISLGIGKGDEVIVPNLTFAASANAIIQSGASPVFCEINPDTWCIDVNHAEKLIGPNTKAIMPVHLYGQPCDLDSLQLLCKKFKLYMIEDCAESLGSEWKHQKVGTFGDAATFSFFGNKTITTGEGGMIIFRESSTADKARVLRDHGMTKNKRYWHDVVGYNYRLTNLQAAIGVAQMERIDSILKKKSLIFDTYNEIFTSTNKNFRKPIKKDNTFHSNWLYGIILNNGINRDQMMKELLLHGIETRPFFYPLNEMTPYKQYRSSKELLISKEISRNGLSLPSSNSLEIDDLNVISKTVLQLIKDRYH